MSNYNPNITEYAKLLLFTRTANQYEIMTELYGEYKPEIQHVQWKRFQDSFKIVIDLKRTLREQKAAVGNLISTTNSKIEQLEKDIAAKKDNTHDKDNTAVVKSKIKVEKERMQTTGITQKAINMSLTTKEIAILKQELYKERQAYKKLEKQHLGLWKGNINTKGLSVYYRAEPDFLLKAWGITDMTKITFFSELLKLEMVDEALYPLNNTLYSYYCSNRDKTKSIDAVYYLSCYFQIFFDKLFSGLYAEVDKIRDKYYEKHTKRDANNELVSFVMNTPFVLTNEILDECFTNYGCNSRIKEFVRKWNLVGLKNQDTTPGDENRSNMGIFNLIWYFKKVSKEATIDKLKDKCEKSVFRNLG